MTEDSGLLSVALCLADHVIVSHSAALALLSISLVSPVYHLSPPVKAFAGFSRRETSLHFLVSGG
jgi:DMSO reductase anchor subunit